MSETKSMWLGLFWAIVAIAGFYAFYSFICLLPYQCEFQVKEWSEQYEDKLSW